MLRPGAKYEELIKNSKSLAVNAKALTTMGNMSAFREGVETGAIELWIVTPYRSLDKLREFRDETVGEETRLFNMLDLAHYSGLKSPTDAALDAVPKLIFFVSSGVEPISKFFRKTMSNVEFAKMKAAAAASSSSAADSGLVPVGAPKKKSKPSGGGAAVATGIEL
jgi:hypothetical protein